MDLLPHSTAVAVLAAYYAVLVPLVLFGVQRTVLLLLSCRRLETPESTGARALPRVLIQLPIFNERFVAERLIRAAVELDYPHHLLEIQVLDDSTDDTTEKVAAIVAGAQAAGVAIRHVHRARRTGYKAGALDYGLRLSEAELVAVFDADFVPERDYLRRMVPAFEDPAVGMAQARWGHLNRRSSLLTRVQALLLDGHFEIEHRGRAAAGLFFNFNGTAGIWRREAIEQAGGWQHDTLTEDLDLSYRAQLHGWRFVYRPDVEVRAELPTAIQAFRSQQQRWTKGSTQTLRKLGSRLLRAPLPLHRRLQALAHLGANLAYPLVVALVLLLFPAMVARLALDGALWVALDLAILAGATLSVALFYLVAAHRGGIGLWRGALLLPPLMALGIGMAWHNACAALSGLWQRGGVFERTPKTADSGRKVSGRKVSRPAGPAYRHAAGARWIAELLLGAVVLAALGLALAWGVYWALPFLALFFSGYGYVLALAWSQRLPRESLERVGG